MTFEAAHKLDWERALVAALSAVLDLLFLALILAFFLAILALAIFALPVVIVSAALIGWLNQRANHNGHEARGWRFQRPRRQWDSADEAP